VLNTSLLHKNTSGSNSKQKEKQCTIVQNPLNGADKNVSELDNELGQVQIENYDNSTESEYITNNLVSEKLI
jgi:hypothetical protein